MMYSYTYQTIRVKHLYGSTMRPQFFRLCSHLIIASMQIMGSVARRTIPNPIRNLRSTQLHLQPNRQSHRILFNVKPASLNSVIAVNSACNVRISHNILLGIIPAHWTKFKQNCNQTGIGEYPDQVENLQRTPSYVKFSILHITRKHP
jgi:hypothetical protein